MLSHNDKMVGSNCGIKLDAGKKRCRGARNPTNTSEATVIIDLWCLQTWKTGQMFA